MPNEEWKVIEDKWQRRWAEAKLFEAEPKEGKPKFFITFPFPYMSGPLHVGHGYTSSRTDACARYKRMCGFNVLFPWAWHWTGETVNGAAKRIKQGDEKFIYALRVIDGVPEEELKKFVEPAYMAKYYTNHNRVAVKRLGLSVDWSREFHTTSLNPMFSRFVEWQYHRLKDGNYVGKGTHPVVWCPKCESPTGEADRLEGSGVSPEEYVVIKYKLDEMYLPAATFRPETIFGVTNLWLNPQATYVEAEVDGEHWIVSKTAAGKLKDQLRKVQVLREFKGEKLLGKMCKEPVGGREIPILPGWFVEPDNASGVVYSVPAHAPYDWIALKDLQENPKLLEEFNLSPIEVGDIKPIPLISIDGFGEFPAVELTEQMKITSQNDPKLEDATKTLYKKEFHGGILKENTGKYAGKPVASVKQELVEDFKRRGIVDTMYDLPQPVVCRCTTKCTVKVLQDQWFLRYSDQEWKAKAQSLLEAMEVYPPEAKNSFFSTIDWLHDWACARKSGLGTPLPEAPGWIVETLSDSTIYPAFYTLNRQIVKRKLKAEQLTDDFFDYAFYGKGEASKVATSSGLSLEALESMRKEFLYWYPVDLRNSGKDLVSNHLTFYIFHHAALFPPEHWPRVIGVNGFMRVEGEEMHKSKGNFIPLLQALEKHGADTARCTFLLAAENMDDPDWRAESLREVKANLNLLHRYILDLLSLKEESERRGHLESWLMSTVHHRIRVVESSLETLKTRTALENALYEFWNDLRWYLRRVDRPHVPTVTEAISIWIRLLAPFIPHLAEELWSAAGGHGFVSNAPWPTYEGKLDATAEEMEDLIKKTLEDIRHILKVTGAKPQKIHIYTAAAWKWNAYLEALKGVEKGDISTKELIKRSMADEAVRKAGGQAAKFIINTVENASRMAPDVRARQISLDAIDEKEFLEDAMRFLSEALGADGYVHREDEPKLYDPKGKAAVSKPYRPAIYIE